MSTSITYVKIKDCCQVVSGATPRRNVAKYWNGEIAWVTPKDISNLCKPVLKDTPEKITVEGLKSCSTTILPTGSVLFSSRAPIGLVAITGKEMCTNQGFKSLIPGAEVSSEYLYWCLRHLTPQITHLGRGATFKEISKEIMCNFEIPLPPLAEQHRIAAILDKADAIRRKRREAINLLDEFLRSVFLDMFGDPVTNPKGWPTSNIGDETNFITSGSRGWAQYYAEEGAIFIRIQNLKSGFLDLSDVAYVHAPESAEAERTRVHPGDVLLSITADLGRTAVIPKDIGEAYINQHLASLRFTSMNPVFISHQLATPGGQSQFARLNRSAVKAGLNFSDVRSIKLIKPPIDRQKDFAHLASQLQIFRATIDRAIADSDALFLSLSQRAFKGEL